MLQHMKVSGVYKITNTANGKFYVGSSVNVRNRLHKHLSQLRRGIHANGHLQGAFTRDGEQALEFQLLEACAPDALLTMEQRHLDALRPEYNICRVAGNTLGVLHGPEAKAKMSAANKGNQRHLGKPHTEETRRVLSSLASQRRASPETRAKMSEAMRGNQRTKGRALSDEHRAKVSTQLNANWSDGTRSREAAAERARAKWADPVWKAQQAEKIKAGKAAKREAQGASQAA